MPMPMKKVEVKVPKSAVSFKVIGIMWNEKEKSLEWFEIPYDDIIDFAEVVDAE